MLKIYDVPVFYFPKFFHPDPTVKRQSGFLAPTFINSSNQSSVFTLPYYHAISDSKDLTLSPRFYSTNKFLTQLEYRSVYAKSKHIIDFSTLNQKNENSKNHFFSESSGEINLDNFEKSEISLQLQSTSNDTYLKSYKLDSPIINDTDTLVSSFNFSAYRSDLAIKSYLTVYEDLSESKKSDKYEYVYPAFNITKELYTSLNSFGDLNLNSNGYMKNHNTNIFEKVLVNDLLFSSYPSFNKSGLKNNFNILFKNTNTDSKNSKKYKNNLNTKLSTLFEYNSSYPLQKKGDNYTNIIKPIISLRYSPNNSKNMRDEERRIDANNIFSLNRISSNESVEGGGSFSFGTEFNKNDELNNEIFSGKIANVFRFEEDKNLPTSSSLGKKTSDIVGSINYNPNKYFSINYEFSEDESLKNTNYQLLKNEFKVNNFISTFEYLNENNTIKNESYLSNKTVFKLSNSTSLGFEARENKKTRATEFYNLIYEYRNDCLIAAIQYNKDYYIDRDYKPSENVFLMLTIIPFGETKSPNIK
ncbi:hypothetical protein ABXT63_01785 [Candidatus Pelagibacter sp. Uisw_092]|uniref:LPS-assembly protein LptD n=1 Tax=Candidatus Pelagibacter sp. Uisw_092 TaxID=3230979 RepID=UPI0039EA5A1F